MSFSRKPTHIILAGCGGSGSYIAPLLANLYYGNSFYNDRGTKTYFFDPDVFESKNKKRQNFSPFYEDKNKAITLSSMYSRALYSKGYGIAVNPYNLDNWAASEQVFRRDNANIWIICATDNNAARVDTLRWLLEKTVNHNLQNWFWITPGNDDSRGQVYTQMCVEGTLCNQNPLEEHLGLLRNSEQRLRDTNSYGCGASPDQGAQSLLANVYAATATIQILINLVENRLYTPEAHFSVQDGKIIFAQSTPFRDILSSIRSQDTEDSENTESIEDDGLYDEEEEVEDYDDDDDDDEDW